MTQLESFKSPDARLDPDILTLEHILPENPDGNWSNYFGAEHVNDFIDRLGNMTVMDKQKNNELARKSFADKAAVYSKSPISITQEISKFEQWSPDSVASRQAAMADVAIKLWSIQFN